MSFIINNNSNFKILLDEYKEMRRFGMHSFHRYFGKLIPAIPAAAIEYYTQPGDYIFEPFLGSGTTLLEAKLRNRNGIGIEINPISYFISKVKTTEIDLYTIEKVNDILINNIYSDVNPVDKNEIPYCINRDHWFWDFVQEDLVRINRNIDTIFENINFNIDDSIQNKITLFYKGVLSAIIRNVSNADPQHVFPGYSKRLRALDAEGKRIIDVKASFARALRKRTSYLSDFENKDLGTLHIINGSSVDYFGENLPKSKLIVTNPPYISSVRYIETMKLELYWMEFLFNSKEYKSLERTMIGNDVVYAKECQEIVYTNFDEINTLIDKIFSICPKNAVVVANYFNSMEKVIKNMNKMLYLDGHVVMKISDSNIKGNTVETGRLLTLIAKQYGFECVDVFTDDIENRSLTTARNSYSDIILYDYIITWRKTGELNEL